MIHRALITALSVGLAAGLLAGDAEAKKRFRNHWFYGYDRYYAGPQYLPPPRYYPYYYEPEYAYRNDFDEDYYDPYYYEPPIRKVKPGKKKTAKIKSAPKKTATVQSPAQKKTSSKPKTAAGLSCEKAETILGGYGFTGIKASDCNGQEYAFNGSRDGKSYAIKLNAASGELTEVRKIR